MLPSSFDHQEAGHFLGWNDVACLHGTDIWLSDKQRITRASKGLRIFECTNSTSAACE